MRRILLTPFLTSLLLCSAFANAQAPSPTTDTPLTEFPYTPGLDVTAMDRAVDPCNDFYQYSCGGWLRNNPIPADQSSWSVYGKLYQDNQRFLWGILEGLSKKAAGHTANQQKLGDYYTACMDEAQIEQRGAQPLQVLLGRIGALQHKSALPALLAQLHRDTGDGGFYFGMGADQDYADSSKVIAFANGGGLSLPERDYYLKTDPRSRKLRAQYVAHVAQMLELLGERAVEARQHAAVVLKIETELARASLSPVDKRDPYKLFHKMDLAKLRAWMPDFDWKTYLDTLQLDTAADINVTEPVFFKTLARHWKTATLDDIRTYLRWHAVHAQAASLSAPFVNADFAFFGNTLLGTPKLQPRWKRCVALVDAQLGEALGQEFVDRAFGPELKARTLKMTEQIEQAMHDDLAGLDWMSSKTKEKAVEKLKAIVNKIGYPDQWRDYSAVAVARDDFYGNVQRATQFEVRRRFDKIGKPLDRGEWGMTPPTVNAYFSPQMNDINFPAGVLQPPLFDPKMDDAPGYGNTGGTIGHELIHGFDDEGRQFDAKGNLKNWWTDADNKKFQQRAQCVVKQFAQYTVVDNIKINSKLTLGEDLADLGGLVLAWTAWKVQTAGQTLENRDGLTPEQRFFVGYAQWACENNRPEALRVQAATDPHSPGKYRVNGVVVNMPEFGKAFACKPGSPMTSVKPCKVW